MYGEILTSMESGSKDSKNTKERNSQKVGEMRGSLLLFFLLFCFVFFFAFFIIISVSIIVITIIIVIIIVIVIMVVKTSGCPDILYNDWAASRSQSMQRPKS